MAGQGRRLRVEPLEDRRMLSITVNTLIDEADGSITDGDISLRDAIEAATIGEIIDFSVTGTIQLNQSNGQLLVSKSLIIDGPAAHLLTIHAGHGTDHVPSTGDGIRIFSVAPGKSLELMNVTLTGGDISGGEENGGEAILSKGQLVLRNTIITQNATTGAEASGGGIWTDSAISATDSVISGNETRGEEAHGGGIYLSYHDSYVGADIYLTRTTISGNSAAGHGGGIFAGYNKFGPEMDVIAEESIITGNTSQGKGGGIYSGYGDVRLTSSSVTGNASVLEGAGIFTADGGTIANSQVSDNAGTGIASFGSSYHGQLNVINSVVSGNGIGIDFSGNRYATFSITNSTISGNQSIGIRASHNLFDANSYISNSTIYGNGGVGVDAEIGGVHISNSIVSGNAGGNFFEVYESSYVIPSFSLIDSNVGTDLAEAPVGSPDAFGNIVGGPIHGIVDPMLGPLQDNGGPTFTHALLVGSPAINAGDPAFTPPPEFDQRGEGFDRVLDGRVDMGAYEGSVDVVLGDFDLDGDVDGRDFMLWQRGGSPNPLSSGDLTLWQGQYGESGELRAEGGEPEIDADPGNAIPGLGSDVAAYSTAPRVMENLGRGVIAVRSTASQVFVSWRLLGLDPAGIAFNVYRSAAGGAAQELNAAPLTAGTNFTDTTASLSVANEYFVRPVIDGVEQEPSGSYTLDANTPVQPMFSIPLRNIGGTPETQDDYYVAATWVGDLDGDGEYEFVVARIPTIANTSDKVEAYRRDGTFLWAIDMGPNSLNKDNIEPGASTLMAGNWDGVTVADLDLDGKAEVAIRTADGVVFGDGTVLNAGGRGLTQFMSLVDGMTGVEKARVSLPTDYIADGTLAPALGVGYLDGVHPSLVAKMKNRIGSGAFNEMIVAWDYDGTALTQKWKWLRGNTPNRSDGHQIRIVDVDQDGADEIVEIGFVLNGDGTVKYTLGPTVVHGDRFHIGDLDPDRPGLEGYGVQQDNPSFLLEYYYDAATGEMLHTHYGTALSDVGRGIAADIDPNHRGYEYWSFSGIYNSKTPVPGEDPVETQLTNDPNRPWPNFRIWWDGDVLSENLNRELIDNWNPATQGTSRLLTAYQYGAVDTWRDAPPFYGDIFGDWREEVIFEHNNHSELQIFTTTTPSSVRLYTLPHNPEYRNSLSIHGYYQSHMVDYYLGDGMATPPTPHIVYATISADFDQDGDVDGRDFMLWQRGGSPNPLGGGDLEAWEEQYGGNELLAVSDQLLARDENGELGSRLRGNDVIERVDREDASDAQSAFEDSYVEEVDRAIEQLATVPSGVRSFGEMVARRGVRRIADVRLRIAD